jgi:hypothetical protein
VESGARGEEEGARREEEEGAWVAGRMREDSRREGGA